MYQEIVITNAENSTIFYFKSVSTWQKDLLRMHEVHKDSWDMTDGGVFSREYSVLVL